MAVSIHWCLETFGSSLVWRGHRPLSSAWTTEVQRFLSQQHTTDFGRQSQGGKEGREIYIYFRLLANIVTEIILGSRKNEREKTEMCQISKSARKLRFPSNSAFPISKIMSLFCLVSESHFLSVIANNRER